MIMHMRQSRHSVILIIGQSRRSMRLHMRQSRHSTIMHMRQTRRSIIMNMLQRRHNMKMYMLQSRRSMLLLFFQSLAATSRHKSLLLSPFFSISFCKSLSHNFFCVFFYFLNFSTLLIYFPTLFSITRTLSLQFFSTSFSVVEA